MRLLSNRAAWCTFLLLVEPAASKPVMAGANATGLRYGTVMHNKKAIAAGIHLRMCKHARDNCDRILDAD